MTSALLILYRSILIGLIAGSGWAVAAYGRAYWTTRLEEYRVMALTMIGLGLVAIIDLALSNPLVGIWVLTPFLPYIGIYLGRCFSPKPTLKFPE